MKKIALTFMSLLLIAGSTLYAQDDKSQRKSPPMTTTGSIGDANITIDYSSPSVKGRKVYGELEKFGKIWRAGANEATTIEFSSAVKINGKELPAGIYAFFVIPKESGDWTIIFNKEAKQWGAYKYDESKDALRTEAKTSTIDNMEKLTYSIERNMVNLDWATTRLSFTIE